jgi:CubicO group peptidase (beta-lactamase class C family)
MNKIRAASIFAIGLACLPFSLGAQADPGALRQKIDAVIDQAIAENRIVGAVVLVAQDGKTVYQRAAGLADKESRKPMQLDALFRLSSVSKPITTVAALALVGRGKLSLDDPVTKWLPDFKPKLVDGTMPTITVRQLLTHTAGLGYKFAEKPDGPYHQAQISDGFDDVRIDLAEELRRLASVPLFSQPGSEWRYSLSIDVLGAVMERAAGKPLGKVVAELVTKPLGMKNTTFVVDRARTHLVAIAYFNAPSGAAPMTDPQSVPFGPMTLVYSPSRAFDPNAYPSAGAGMIGTAPDVLRLLEAMRKGGAPVLEQSTAAELFRNQIEGKPGFQPGMGFGLGGGLVVDPAAVKTPQSAGTLFWGGVYGHTWFVDPTKELTVVALTNTAPEGMAGRFPDGLRDAVYEGIPPSN